MRITFRRATKTFMTDTLSYDIRVGGRSVGRVQQIQADSWFWYADGINTHATPTTLDECKRQVKDHYRPLPAPPAANAKERTET